MAIESPGQPLPPATRAFLEPRLGHDFSRVRVHADGVAAHAARAVGALAFTVGDDIVFGAGRYRPDSPSSTPLLAHELVHVVQPQSPGSIRRSPGEDGADDQPIVPADHPSEREAEAVSREVTSGRAGPPPRIVQRGSGGGTAIQRAVYWDDRTNGKLTWADYTATPPQKGSQAPDADRDAVTVCGMDQITPKATVSATPYPKPNPPACEVKGTKTVQYQAKANYDPASLDVRAMMAPESSWVRSTTKTDSLLSHEQGHFDIAHVIAEKVEACILPLARASEGTAIGCGGEPTAAAATAQFLQKEQGDAMLKAWGNGSTLLTTIQSTYDTETNHSRNRTKQGQWLTAIGAGLPKYPLACPAPARAPAGTQPAP